MSLKALQLPPLVFAGEEKLQHWQPVSLGYAPVSYAITHGPNVQKVDQVDWPNDLFGCCNARSASVSCFLANCCCCTQLFLRQGAYDLVDLGNEARAVATMRVFASAIPQGGGDGGGNMAGALGGAVNAAAAYRASGLRIKLSNRLYGRNADGGTFGSAFKQCCCVQCANAQEIDAILTYIEDTRGVQLRYGTFCTPRCCNFVNEQGENVTMQTLNGPQGLTMQRGAQSRGVWRRGTNMMSLPESALRQQEDRKHIERLLDQQGMRLGS